MDWATDTEGGNKLEIGRFPHRDGHHVYRDAQYHTCLIATGTPAGVARVSVGAHNDGSHRSAACWCVVASFEALSPPHSCFPNENIRGGEGGESVRQGCVDVS